MDCTTSKAIFLAIKGEYGKLGSKWETRGRKRVAAMGSGTAAVQEGLVGGHAHPPTHCASSHGKNPSELKENVHKKTCSWKNGEGRGGDWNPSPPNLQHQVGGGGRWTPSVLGVPDQLWPGEHGVGILLVTVEQVQHVAQVATVDEPLPEVGVDQLAGLPIGVVHLCGARRQGRVSTGEPHQLWFQFYAKNVLKSGSAEKLHVDPTSQQEARLLG